MNNLDIKIKKQRDTNLWHIEINTGSSSHNFYLYHSEMRQLVNEIPDEFIRAIPAERMIKK